MPQLDFDGANSKISADKIQGQSGTTVTVPTGHTVAITDSGGLTLAGTAVNAGSLGKVLQGPIIDTWPERTSTTSTTKVAVDADWSASITPSATSSKVLIQCQFEYIHVSTTAYSTHMTIYRDSTDIDPSASTGWQHGLWLGYSHSASGGWWTGSFMWVDEPNTPSAVVYKPYWWVESGQTMRIGGANNTTENIAKLYVWEIGA